MVMQKIKALLSKKADSNETLDVQLTSTQEIQSLIEKLHPLATDKGLLRLGPQGDGGYLVPNDLQGIEACFSPGVSNVSGFEKDCANLGMKVFMADGSVDHAAEQHKLFKFDKKYIGALENDYYMTLDQWVNREVKSKKSDLLLQMDIEGGEYETLFSMSDGLLKRFRIMAIEFHQLDQLWNRPFFQLISRVFEKILKTHQVVHLHPNNCCSVFTRDGLEIPRVMEFTFLRNVNLLGIPQPKQVSPKYSCFYLCA